MGNIQHQVVLLQEVYLLSYTTGKRQIRYAKPNSQLSGWLTPLIRRKCPKVVLYFIQLFLASVPLSHSCFEMSSSQFRSN